MKSLLPVSVILSLALVACGGQSEEDKILEMQSYSQIMKTDKDLVDPVHGKEVKFYYGAVSGVAPVNANGLAYVHVFEDGTSTVTVNLNIEVQSGAKYIVSIENASGTSSLKVGVLRSLVGDVRHTVTMQTKNDLATSLVVVVRREGKGEPVVVAKGTMKEPAAAK